MKYFFDYLNIFFEYKNIEKLQKILHVHPTFATIAIKKNDLAQNFHDVINK